MKWYKKGADYYNAHVINYFEFSRLSEPIRRKSGLSESDRDLRKSNGERQPFIYRIREYGGKKSLDVSNYIIAFVAIMLYLGRIYENLLPIKRYTTGCNSV